jgi:hypothetical protein
MAEREFWYVFYRALRAMADVIDKRFGFTKERKKEVAARETAR